MSFKKHSSTVEDIKPEEIKETRVNEPLTNWHAFDGQLALDAIYESGGCAEYASDTRMLDLSRLLRREEGLSVLPASTSTLAVLQSLCKNNGNARTAYVAILTGRNFD